MDRHALSGVRYAPEKMYIIEVQEGECWHCTEVCFSQSVADVLVLTLPNSRYRLVKVWDASDLGLDHTNFDDVKPAPKGHWGKNNEDAPVNMK